MSTENRQAPEYCNNLGDVGKKLSSNEGNEMIASVLGGLKILSETSGRYLSGEEVYKYSPLFSKLFGGGFVGKLNDSDRKELRAIQGLRYYLQTSHKRIAILKKAIHKEYDSYIESVEREIHSAGGLREYSKTKGNLRKLKQARALGRALWGIGDGNLDTFIALVDHLLEGKPTDDFVIAGRENEIKSPEPPERVRIFRKWWIENIGEISKESKEKIMEQARIDEEEGRLAYDPKTEMTWIDFDTDGGGYTGRVGGSVGIPSDRDGKQMYEWKDKGYITYRTYNTHDNKTQHGLTQKGIESDNVDERTNPAALWVLAQNPGARFEGKEELTSLLHALGNHIGLDNEGDKIAAMMYYTTRYGMITAIDHEIGPYFNVCCYKNNRISGFYTYANNNIHVFPLIKD